ncbi:MAG: hypothetical protein A4E20_10995 [Nitrospira sp. SG-bin2]|nr:MAG: hypothetical protein A4E20_10995 [Nitrospira sp. SG-bin2]
MSELGQRLIERVRHHAVENPDFVYQPANEDDEYLPGVCSYIRDGKPSCLVGHALWDCGVIDDTLGEDLNTWTDIRSLDLRMNLAVDAEEIQWLSDVQDAQDIKIPWGTAVKRADDE